MRVLITGGFGYIGGRLGQLLVEQGCDEVILAARKTAESPAWLPKVSVRSISWESDDSLAENCRGVDTVVHLAGMNAQECASKPAAALAFNGVGTARLLAAAERAKVKRFIYLSTAHVYAAPLRGIIDEQTCPMSLHPYATSHRAGEDVVRVAHRAGRIEGIVLRLSNAYGAPAHANVNCWMLLLNELCRQAVSTQRIMLRSSGLQRRDFIPLSDACAAIAHILHLPGARLGDGLFNIGGDWTPTVWEMACLVQDRCSVLLGYRPELTRPEPGAGESSEGLEYRWEPLRHSEFNPVFARELELDGLLLFCREHFR